MSLEQQDLQREFGQSRMDMVRRKCIILLLCDDGKIRAVMEEPDPDFDPPAGAAWPLLQSGAAFPKHPAIRVFDDADDAVLFAVNGPLQDETFQIVELEDMGIFDD